VTADDLVVLLDPRGNAIGTAPRTGVHHRDTPLHLAFSCYAVDPDQRLLVTRRAHDKATFPGLWTNTVCGHPAPGESLTDAVRRRAADELGLTIQELRLMLPTYTYRAEMEEVVEYEWCPVLLAPVRADAVCTPSPAEVDQVAWIPWDRIVALAQDPPPQWSPWAMEQVRLLHTLGPDPLAWPPADAALLPPALRRSTA
jgi:isopentenyl-diphosphate delta-isomerase